MNNEYIQKLIKVLDYYKKDDDIVELISYNLKLIKDAFVLSNKSFLGFRICRLTNYNGIEIKVSNYKNSFKIVETEKTNSENKKSEVKIKLFDNYICFAKRKKVNFQEAKVEARLMINPQYNYILFDDVEIQNNMLKYKDVKKRNKIFAKRRAEEIKKNALI